MNNQCRKTTESLTYYKRLVGFQEELMEKIYAEREEIYGLISEYCGCCHMFLIVCDEKGMVAEDMYTASSKQISENYQFLNGSIGKVLQCSQNIWQEKHSLPEAIQEYLDSREAGGYDRVTSFSGKVNSALYAVILCHKKEEQQDISVDVKLVNYIQKYMENRIFHEMVTFESQHDMLTRLYNRRYYFKCCQEEYPSLHSIGLFYFDVNNLKEINDNYGHDAGDALLQKAAESIRCLTCDTVQGFRMGGDEFVVVVMNGTRKDMEDISKKWEEELQKVNEKYGGDPCVIAMGCAYGEGSFEIEKLCQLADKRMYQDKINKKKGHRA
ncbi:MAG: GGDEF domain-containing protein [Butyribacter sp.]|nr:GGDEF domain-containing protein [bacterium]MDY3853381.1 GGDEF domain-containing protein [Butyribacter sp.]